MTRPSLLDLPLKEQVRPRPIPDRLLVQIAPSEIADPFRAEAGGCRPAPFVDDGLIPGDLGLTQIHYRGVARDGQALFSVRLPEAAGEAEIRRAFEGIKGRVLEVAERGRPLVAGREIAVGFDPRDLDEKWETLCEPNYFYLQKRSSLHHVLREIGTISMRRVFRSLEQPDRTRRGYFTVRRFNDVVDAAKKANPRRTARAYSWTELVQEHRAREYALPGQSLSISEGVAVDRGAESLRPARPPVSAEAARLADLLQRKPARGRDNMENWFVLRLRPGVDLRAALARLEQLAIVQRASLDYPFRPAQVDDPEWDDQWGLRNTGTFQNDTGGLAGFDIGIEDAWAVSPTGESVTVAVIDTGINEDLDEFETRLWTNPGESPTGQAGVDDDCNGYVDDVHGITTYDRFLIDYGDNTGCSVSPGGPSMALDPHATTVAGIIAARTNNGAGIAGTAGTDPVELMNLTLGTLSGRQWPPGWSEFAEAMFYAISPKPDGSVPGADVVNMSILASACSYLGFQSIYAALDSGLILVGAAGNDAIRFDVDEHGILGIFPASVPGVITVGGSTRSGRWWPSSNYGPGLDLVAPAEEVRALSYDSASPGQSTVITAAGTSLSAAFVSGAAAVILARYPDMSNAPSMRHWLRAKATDMLDPLGDGSSHVGDDEWTGAGMLSAGNATTALANANDQPVVVALGATRSKNFRGFYGWGFPARPLAVGGQPDLGIRVQGSSLSSWSLSYGLGDAPTTWTDISVSPPSLTQQETDFEWQSGGGIVPSGRNYLDTDALTNRQVYTLRLQAENLAGSKFTAYDYVIPIRAEVLFPSANWTLVPAWGWLPVGGFIDSRPASDFHIALYDAANRVVWDTGPQTLWQPGPYTPPHLAERTPTVAHPLLSNFTSYFASGDAFPAASPGLSEGWYEYRLGVDSPAGSDLDAVRFYTDTTHFGADYWPLLHEPIETSPGESLADLPLAMIVRSQDVLMVSESGGASAPRLFLKAANSVMALDGYGALAWEKRDPPPQHNSGSFSHNMVITDVDNDGSREILYALNENAYLGDVYSPMRMVLLDADSGSPFNGSWPKTFSRPRKKGPGYLAAADVLGDDDKEIILVEPRWLYYGIPADEVTPAIVRVLDLAGNELWTREFPIETASVGPVETADLDGDGKAEIVLGSTGLILKGNNTFLIGWNTDAFFGAPVFVAKGGSATPDLLGRAQGGLTLKAPDGTTRSGWPVQAVGVFAAGQIVTGGDAEIVVCGETIQVFDSAGAAVASVPEITLDGRCSEVLLLDVDGDDTDELLALVQRYKEDPAADERLGSFLEAYRPDGTRLADSDDSWPIVVAPRDFYGGVYPAALGRQLAIGDVDGDALPEVVQLLPIGPYGVDRSYVAPSARVEVLNLQ